MKPETFTVEHVEHNPDGTTTLYGTTSSGRPIVHTYQRGERVVRVGHVEPE